MGVWLFVATESATDGSPTKRPRSQQITVAEAVPPDVRQELLLLAEMHPRVQVLTVTKRKNGWGIYASHSGIAHVLKGPRRQSEQSVPYIQQWLKEAAPAPTEATCSAHPLEPVGGIQTVALQFWESQEGLSELSVQEVDGVVVVSATHASTLYSIERCYSSWDLAKVDLRAWSGKLSCANTTAMAPRHSGSAARRDYGLRDVALAQYTDSLRPSALGRAAGPGRRKVEKSFPPRTFEQQLNGILRRKCEVLQRELSKSQAEHAALHRKHQQLQASVANALHPDRLEINAEQGVAAQMFPQLGSGYSEIELTRTIYNHITAVMSSIQSVVGDDAIKALQLADRVQQRARGQLGQHQGQEEPDSKYVQMCVGVFESLQGFLKDLQDQYTTKAPAQVKSIMQTVVTAIMADYDATSQRYLAEKLELNRDWLVNGEARAATFYEEGLLDQIADVGQAPKSDRIPDVWKRFCF